MERTGYEYQSLIELISDCVGIPHITAVGVGYQSLIELISDIANGLDCLSIIYRINLL